MNKYSELTDFQINALLAPILGFKVFDGPVVRRNGDQSVMIEGEGKKDWCDSWEYAGPLIVEYNLKLSIRPEHRIGSHYVQTEWVFGNQTSVYFEDKRQVLRAICECVLMINDRSE